MDTEAIVNSDLVRHLQSIRDYRSKRGQRYPLWVMLLVTILGVMSGAQGYQAIEDFGKRHYRTLCELLAIELKRLPSDTTLRRMFHAVATGALSEWFNQSASSACQLPPVAAVAVDGKSIRGSLVNQTESSQNFVGVVSAYSQQQHCILGQLGYQNKQQSEIGVVQQLLEQLSGTEILFTLDALHCQKKRRSR